MKTAVIRKAHFNAAHRLNNPAWDIETNKKVFGKCNNDKYHGHNYIFYVKLIGEINPDTGYVFDLGVLSNLIKEHVEEPFDHRNLNLDTAEFKNLNPTAENIAMVIYNKLRAHIEPKYDLKITLYETENNFIEYPA
jgi:6-pyruvoyltetrahydropterin/6-carboxytetrahydropterin synthase